MCDGLGEVLHCDPELLIDEKERLLARCVERGTRLLLTHDPEYAIASVEIDERDRYRGTGMEATVRGLRL